MSETEQDIERDMTARQEALARMEECVRRDMANGGAERRMGYFLAEESAEFEKWWRTVESPYFHGVAVKSAAWMGWLARVPQDDLP